MIYGRMVPMDTRGRRAVGCPRRPRGPASSLRTVIGTPECRDPLARSAVDRCVG
jgi:hypothetical protein